jgi:hypothetical protein
LDTNALSRMDSCNAGTQTVHGLFTLTMTPIIWDDMHYCFIWRFKMQICSQHIHT